MPSRHVTCYDRAQFNRMILQRDWQKELDRRSQEQTEAVGPKSDGESEPTAE